MGSFAQLQLCLWQRRHHSNAHIAANVAVEYKIELYIFFFLEKNFAEEPKLSYVSFVVERVRKKRVYSILIVRAVVLHKSSLANFVCMYLCTYVYS